MVVGRLLWLKHHQLGVAMFRTLSHAPQVRAMTINNKDGHRRASRDNDPSERPNALRNAGPPEQSARVAARGQGHVRRSIDDFAQLFRHQNNFFKNGGGGRERARGGTSL
jgi:hypothetical protein